MPVPSVFFFGQICSTLMVQKPSWGPLGPDQFSHFDIFTNRLTKQSISYIEDIRRTIIQSFF